MDRFILMLLCAFLLAGIFIPEKEELTAQPVFFSLLFPQLMPETDAKWTAERWWEVLCI